MEICGTSAVVLMGVLLPGPVDYGSSGGAAAGGGRSQGCLPGRMRRAGASIYRLVVLKGSACV
jgi:hypothetical protein